MKRISGNSLLFKSLKFGEKNSLNLWSFESLNFGAKSSSFYGHLSHKKLESKALHFMISDGFTFTLTCFIFCGNFILDT